MASRANIKATVSADTTQFSTAMRRAGTQAALVSRRIGKSMMSATRAIGGIAASATKAAASISLMGGAIVTAGLAKGIKDAADLGGRLSDLSAQTGAAAGQLAILQRAMEDNGVSGEEVGSVLNKMQRIISDAGDGMESAARPFEQLGITIEELRRLKPDEQFRLIGQRINGIVDPTERAQTAMEIFGRSGGKLLTLFADTGAFSNASKFLGTQAEILDRSSGIFDSIADKLARVPDKLTGFFVGFLEPIAGTVDSVLQKFDNYDFAALGQRISNGLVNLDMGKITALFVSLADVVSNAMIEGFRNAAIIANAVFASLWESDTLPKMMRAFIDRMILATMDIAQAQIDIIKGVFSKSENKVEPQVDVAEIVNDAIGKVELPGFEGTRKAIDKLEQTIGQMFPKIGDGANITTAGPSAITPSVIQPTPQPPSAPQQDGTKFGPDKNLAGSPQIFGPDKSLMSDRGRIFQMLQKRGMSEAAAGFGGLSERTMMQASRVLGQGPGTNTMLSGGRGSGRWAGVANASVTGGLGEKRRLRTSKDDRDAKKQLSLQEQQQVTLESIDSNIKQAVTVG